MDKTKTKKNQLGGVWLYYLNNSFHCLNNTTHIFTVLFYSQVFLQLLNNIAKITLQKKGLLFSILIHETVDKTKTKKNQLV